MLPREMFFLIPDQPAGSSGESCESAATFRRVDILVLQYKIIGNMYASHFHFGGYPSAELT
jgi:hypothetical protein